MARSIVSPVETSSIGPSLPYAGSRDVELADLQDHTLAGRFNLGEIVGRGGYGAVFRAVQLSIHRTCAVKVLDPEYCTMETTVARFRREAEMTSELKHPNTVVVHDFGHDEDLSVLFLAMEYTDGETLRDHVARHGPLEVDSALRVARQVAGSLREAHDTGMVHRDVKPHNLMLTSRAEEEHFVKVIDFGIAKALQPELLQDGGDTLTVTDHMLGTPKYMAPEQLQDDGVGAEADQYALAVTMYWTLAGRLPFEGDNDIQIATRHIERDPPPLRECAPTLDVSTSFEDVLLKALSKRPASRFDTIVQFVRALEEARRETSSHDLAPPETYDFPRPHVESDVDSEDSFDRSDEERGSDGVSKSSKRGGDGTSARALSTLEAATTQAARDVEGEAPSSEIDVDPTREARLDDPLDGDFDEPPTRQVDPESIGSEGAMRDEGRLDSTELVPSSEVGASETPETGTTSEVEAPLEHARRRRARATSDVSTSRREPGSPDDATPLEDDAPTAAPEPSAPGTNVSTRQMESIESEAAPMSDEALDETDPCETFDSDVVAAEGGGGDMAATTPTPSMRRETIEESTVEAPDGEHVPPSDRADTIETTPPSRPSERAPVDETSESTDETHESTDTSTTSTPTWIPWGFIVVGVLTLLGVLLGSIYLFDAIPPW